jgi:hypothetical protein
MGKKGEARHSQGMPGLSLFPHQPGRLSLLKGAGHLTEVECIAILDGGSLVGFQAFAVDACGVRAIQVGQSIGTANMLNGSMNARDGIGPLHIAQVHLRSEATNVVVGTSHQCAFARELYLLAIAEGQHTPHSIGIESRLIGRSWLNRFACRYGLRCW